MNHDLHTYCHDMMGKKIEQSRTENNGNATLCYHVNEVTAMEDPVINCADGVAEDLRSHNVHRPSYPRNPRFKSCVSVIEEFSVE